jgi:hypothetical protein
MSCCGNKREQLRQTIRAHPVPTPVERPSSQPQPERNSPVYFQYIGKTGLIVMGPWTHRRYYFDSPGAMVAVDRKDRRALAAIPTLKEVRKTTNVAKG